MGTAWPEGWTLVYEAGEDEPLGLYFDSETVDLNISPPEWAKRLCVGVEGEREGMGICIVLYCVRLSFAPFKFQGFLEPRHVADRELEGTGFVRTDLDPYAKAVWWARSLKESEKTLLGEVLME